MKLRNAVAGLLTALVTVGVALSVSAQTSVPGATITGDEVWDLAGSPYMVTGQVTIPSSSSLTIESGVTVDFGTVHIEFGVFLVSGHFEATNVIFDGTQVAEANNWFVVEMRNGGSAILSGCTLAGRWTPPNVHGKDWRGIQFHEDGIGTVTVTDCDFSGFNNCIYMGRTAHLDVRNCNFSNSNSAIGAQRSCTYDVSGSRFSMIEANALTVNEQAEATVTDCTFDNSPNAIGVLVYDGQIEVTGCCFSGLAMAVDNRSATQQLAENNWWGSFNGPTHPSNPGGTGESISGPVDFNPFFTSADCPLTSTDDLIAHWDFNENGGNVLHDITGNGHDGVIHGSPTRIQGVGSCGYAIDFDGVDDYVEIPILPDVLFKDQSVTFAAWVQVPDNSERGPMFLTLIDAADGAPRIQLLKRRAGSLNGRYNMQLQSTTVEYNALSMDDGDALAKNAWTHLVGVVDFSSKHTKLYINGMPQTDSPNQFSSFDMATATDLTMNIGIWRDEQRDPCKIDEVRVYNRALSQAEVEELFQEDNPVADCPGESDWTQPYASDDCTIGLWHADDALETDLEDASDNHNDGTVFGALRALSQPGFGEALCFGDGDSAQADLSCPSFITGSHTVEAWIYPTSIGSHQTILSLYGIGDQIPMYLWPDGRVSFRVVNNAHLSPQTEVYSTTVLEANKRWYHVAARWNEAEHKFAMFINGVLESEIDVPWSPTPLYSNTLDIGKVWTAQTVPNGAANFFQGYIDEVRISNVARTFAEPDSRLRVSVDIKPRTCPNLIPMFPGFDEGEGDDEGYPEIPDALPSLSRAAPPLEEEEEDQEKVDCFGWNRWIPVAILGGPDFSVRDLDLKSVRLQGVRPARLGPWVLTRWRDVATPAIDDPAQMCECTDEGRDGHRDVTLWFSRHKLLDEIGPLEDGDVLALELTGLLKDGSEIVGSDCIEVYAYSGFWSSSSNATKSVDQASVPYTFALGQNYPNPFNAGTVIEFELETDGEVHLEVFDVLGRRIATLMGGSQSAGHHSVAWDGCTSSGAEAASGMYFYRLRSDSRVVTRKMVLVR